MRIPVASISYCTVFVLYLGTYNTPSTESPALTLQMTVDLFVYLDAIYLLYASQLLN